jgi:polar amino acid transport system substrate-binding protein/arginine/ornithine transport system substrate-binding protein
MPWEERMRGDLGSAVVLAVLAAAGPAGALEVCVEGAYPPFSQVTADGTIVGFDIDIAAALCGEIGEECRYRLTGWERMIPALTEGVCDAIVASMSDTDARRVEIDFTERYYRSPVRFVGPEGGAGEDTPAALTGKVVGVQRDTINQLFMDRHYPGTPVRLYGNQEHVLLDLTLGRLDAVLGEAVQLDAGFLRTPAGKGFAFFGGAHFDPEIQGRGAAIGVRKADTELRDRLNAAIAAIRADGRYDAIAGRYFDIDIYGE